MVKVNGFTNKIHPFQIITYVYFIGIIVVYFLTIFPLSSPKAKIIGAVLQVSSAIVLAISGYITTVSDPSDPHLKETIKARAVGKSYAAPEADFHCSVDKSYVFESSKHCRRCGRCTEQFDHHCKWVNNDVGKSNYKAFFVMINSVIVFLSVFLVFGALVTVNFARDRNFTNYEIFMYENDYHDILAGLVILWICMALSFLFFLLDLNLVLFHFFLIKKGLTTFQYITLVEERRENKKELEYAKKIMGYKKNTRLDFILCLDKNRKNRKAKSGSLIVKKNGKEQELQRPDQEAESGQSQQRTAEILSEVKATKEDSDQVYTHRQKTESECLVRERSNFKTFKSSFSQEPTNTAEIKTDYEKKSGIEVEQIIISPASITEEDVETCNVAHSESTPRRKRIIHQDFIELNMVTHCNNIQRADNQKV